MVDSPSESSSLFEDLLINVTCFMRDPDVFKVLEEAVLPRLLSEPDRRSPIRVWVPGCATGEEVYSLGISLLETASRLSSPVELCLFGTDLNEKSIAFARTGTYTEAQLAYLSPKRRERYFTRVNGRFQVVKRLRQMCVFARHNLASDAPFSRMDLVSCRNVLIYMGAELQTNVVRSFHYALRSGGYLVLGQSEGLGEATALFGVVDKSARVYQKKGDAESYQTARGELSLSLAAAPIPISSPPAGAISAEHMAAQIAASVYGPVWILIDEAYRLLQSSGDTSGYLRLPRRSRHV